MPIQVRWQLRGASIPVPRLQHQGTGLAVGVPLPGVRKRLGLRLLIKKIDNDGRLSLLPQFLDTPWEIEVVDSEDLAALEHALARADAMVSMSWKWELRSANRLKLLQLPGAGTDEIDFARVPPRTADLQLLRA